MHWKLLLVVTLTTLLVACGRAQDVPDRLLTGHAELDQKLARMVTADSLALSAREAAALEGAAFLDARELEEYGVSHLPGAIPLGYDDPDFDLLNGMDLDRPLVVYCTVGYRSERMAEKLREAGFRRVYNLYGSIYAWKLAGLPVEDARGATDRIHTYNRKWGGYAPDSIGVKVW